jgi:phospholipase C
MTLDRRTFVKGALGASEALLLGDVNVDRAGATAGSANATRAANATRLSNAAAAATDSLPPPATSGIEHVIDVMMENRSFDHFLGWLPHADGRQAGLSYADP